MIKKTAAIYSILVGLSIILMWIMFYVTGSIPELESEPARIVMHITAEFITAIALITCGWGLLTLKKWGYQLYLPATGALIYTLVQSPGYFLHTGETALVLMFAVMLLATLLLLIKMVKSS